MRDAPHDEVRLDDLPARPTAPAEAPEITGGSSRLRPSSDPSDDDIISIQDLTPRTSIKGGRKTVLGEGLAP